MEKDCTECDGRGEYRGYGDSGVCHGCLGTGKQLTLDERRFVEGILKMLSVRLGRGFQ